MYHYNRQTIKKSKKRPAFAVFALAIFGAGLFLATAKNLLSFPVVQGSTNFVVAPIQDKPVKIAWPQYGQSAVGAVGFGVLEQSSDKKAQPTASVAKVMTALAVLEKHPLKSGETGPTIQISEKDEALFGEYFAKNGTSVRLEAGSEVNLYQALQYILIPSANNVADTTANWAFGSMEDYSKFANDLAKTWGMTDSNFADASGFSPSTVSTAHDLVLLGEKAMQNPVVAEIVKTWEIQLPDGSKAQNSNVFLDFEGNGVIGIKTGDTDQAGGVYLTAAEHEVEDEKVTIVAVAMGAKTLTQAQQDAMKILSSAKSGFSKEKIVSQGQVVGSYNIPWQGNVDVVNNQDVWATVWASKAIDLQVKLKDISGVLSSNEVVGEVVISSGSNSLSNPVNLSSSVISPPTAWKIRKYAGANDGS